MRKIQRTCLLILPLAIWTAVLPADQNTDLASLIAPSLPIERYECSEEEIEIAKPQGYRLWCARSAVKFKEFRQRWDLFLTEETILEYRNEWGWEFGRSGIRSFKFWYGDLGGVLLFSKKDDLVRILLRDATRLCVDIDQENTSEIRKEAVFLPMADAPKKIRDQKPFWPEGTPGTPGRVVVSVSMVLDREGVPRDLCIMGTKPEHVPRFREAAVDAILKWRYEPILHDGRPQVVFRMVTVEFTSPWQKFGK